MLQRHANDIAGISCFRVYLCQNVAGLLHTDERIYYGWLRRKFARHEKLDERFCRHF